MVLVHQVQEPIKQVLGFHFRHSVDVADVAADWENALPSGHRVGPNDGMNGLEHAADVFGGATLLVVKLEAGAFGDLVEVRLCKGRGQRLEEFLEGLADLVVDFVA
jgi:hypothetical protein